MLVPLSDNNEIHCTYYFFVPSSDFCLCSNNLLFFSSSVRRFERGVGPPMRLLSSSLMEKGFDRGRENRISLFFVEPPNFLSWVYRFSFTRGRQVCDVLAQNSQILLSITPGIALSTCDSLFVLERSQNCYPRIIKPQ